MSPQSMLIKPVSFEQEYSVLAAVGAAAAAAAGRQAGCKVSIMGRQAESPSSQLES